jgi:vacuolar-type H+-ATPase subunit F/Vma7
MTRARWMIVAWLTAGLTLAGCAKTSEAEKHDKAVKLVAVPGSDVQQVVLTERAAQRLDIQMRPVVEEAGVKVVPYASVVYEANGTTWVYTSPAPFTFVRTPVTVANIVGDRALLSAGPGAGTPVVTVGTAELFGSEKEIGH